MTVTAEKMGQAQVKKLRLFKSKKELALLVVSAVVFAFVLHRMYSKRAKPPEVAELAEAAQAAGGGPSAPSVQEVLVAASAEDPGDSGPVETPAAPARDPFAMTEAMRNEIYRSKVGTQTVERPPEVIVLTAQNWREVLARIPGAEEAGRAGLRLEATMTAGAWQAAVINGKVVVLGKSILGFRLAEVLEDGAVLELGKQRVKLLIPRAETGGEASP